MLNLDAAGQHIQRYYDGQADNEWQRLERHRTEYAVTMRAMAEYLPPPPARVLDCGGGPGRYAVELARQGYQVVLFDISAEELRLAEERASAAGVTLAGYEHGTAVDLSRFPDGSFDAVLLMGPLYHLFEEKDRRQALAEARRVLKPGGALLASFLGRYAILRYAAADEPEWVLENSELVEMLLERGIVPPRAEGRLNFATYSIPPGEVAPLCRSAGFELLTILGVEGLVSMAEEKVNALQGRDWQRWAELNYRVAADPCLHGVEHLLAVAVKPLWRTVLREIAGRLNEAGVQYHVAGGTAAALHGVPVPVKDIDIDTNLAGVYRFQEIFQDRVRQPVAWSEGGRYRSHFSRFDFGGLLVEVMAELEWNDGERWIAVSTSTDDVVEVEGVAVHTASLEEETLAYIRRGRLDRAAECLRYCDGARISQLLLQKRAKEQ